MKLSHIVIIPDGNRRWAENNKIILIDSYRIACEKILLFTEYMFANDVNVLTVWGASPQNLNRDASESALFLRAILEFISVSADKIISNKCKVNLIGDRRLLSALQPSLVSAIEKLEASTEHFENHILNIALAYSWEYEIQNYLDKLSTNKCQPPSIDDFKVSGLFSGQPEIDLIVRTGGEKRLSGFFPLHGSFSEIYFYDQYVQDIDDIFCEKILNDFLLTNRRYGQ